MFKWFSTKQFPHRELLRSKMNDYMLYIAIAVQLLIATIIFYVDAKNTIEPLWENVLRFGLNPFVLLFFALTPIVMWWAYRVIYQFADGQFWYAAIMHTLIFQIAFIGSSYIARREAPSPRNWISLSLVIVAVLVSAK